MVPDVAGATHRNAQEAVELDWLMRVRTSSLSDAFSFKSSPRIVPTSSTQPSASSTHRSASSLWACCFPSRAVALPVVLSTTFHSWYGESCVFVAFLGASLTCNALRAHQHTIFIWWVTDWTVIKDGFIASSLGETDLFTSLQLAIKCSL